MLPDGSEVKLGVFLSSAKTCRANLAVDKFAPLAGIGPGVSTRRLKGWDKFRVKQYQVLR